MKLKHLIVSAFFLSFVFLLSGHSIAQEELKSVWGISAFKSPFKGSGNVGMRYFDGFDDYRPNLSINANKPIGYEAFYMAAGKAMDYSVKLGYLKQDVDVISIGAGVQTKGFNQKRPFIGARLVYARISSDSLGQVPAGNNTGANFMFAWDSNAQITQGTDFKFSKSSFGADIYAGYLFPVSGKNFLYLEAGLQNMSQSGKAEIEAGGHEIPCNANGSGGRFSTCSSSPSLDLSGVYFKVGFGLGR